MKKYYIAPENCRWTETEAATAEAAYKRGLQDGKTIARNERIAVFRRKKTPSDYIDKI